MVRVRGLRGAAAGPLRGAARGRPRARCSSAPCRSARARRSTSRSSSRTCTAPATRWPRSTATSSRSRGGTPVRGREAPGADRGGRTRRRRSPRWSTCRRPARGRRRLCGRIRGWTRIKASAPWPQRRTAPFRCQGRSASALRNRPVMYAIVKTGGKQYRVEEGQSLLVERLPVEDGARSRFSRCCSSTASESWTATSSRTVTVAGSRRRPRARSEAADRQVQAQARLQAAQRPPPGADPARGHGDQVWRRRKRAPAPEGSAVAEGSAEEAMAEALRRRLSRRRCRLGGRGGGARRRRLREAP